MDTFRHKCLLPPRGSSLWKDKGAVGSRSLAAWGTESSEGCSPRLADIMFHIFCGRRSTSFYRLAISPYFILVCNLKLLTFNLISIQQSLIKHPLWALCWAKYMETEVNDKGNSARRKLVVQGKSRWIIGNHNKMWYKLESTNEQRAHLANSISQAIILSGSALSRVWRENGNSLSRKCWGEIMCKVTKSQRAWWVQGPLN